jgi:hypothetical protein
MEPHEFENKMRAIAEAQQSILLACRAVHWSGASADSIKQLAVARAAQYAAIVNAIGRDAIRKATRPKRHSSCTLARNTSSS